MDNFNFMKTLKSKNILLVLLGVFILFDIEIPKEASNFLNTVFGKVLVFSMSVSAFSLGPVFGAMSMVAAYILFVRSNKGVRVNVSRSIPSEEKKEKFFKNVEQNEFPRTLEEKMVQQMVPLVHSFDSKPDFGSIN